MHTWMSKVCFFTFELKNKQMLKRKDQTSWCFLLPFFFHILFPVGKKKSLVTDTLLQCCTLNHTTSKILVTCNSLRPIVGFFIAFFCFLYRNSGCFERSSILLFNNKHTQCD